MTRVEFSRYLVCKTQYPKDGDLDQLTVVNLITLKSAQKSLLDTCSVLSEPIFTNDYVLCSSL